MILLASAKIIAGAHAVTAIRAYRSYAKAPFQNIPSRSFSALIIKYIIKCAFNLLHRIVLMTAVHEHSSKKAFYYFS